MAHIAATFLGARPEASVRLVGDDDLVHQRFVVLAPEERVGSRDRGRALALVVEDLELHHAPLAAGAGLAAAAGLAAGAAAGLAAGAPAWAAALGLPEGPFGRIVFEVGRTTMSRPRLPGTEPLTSSSCRSASTRTTISPCAVRFTAPRCPAMRLPGNTRPGSCAIPVEPGLLCEIELPWLARLDEKW